MTTYARNVNNTAVDVTTTDPTTIFYPTIAAEFITVPAGTLTGATYASGIWTAPIAQVAPPAPPAPPVKYPLLTPMQLYLAFTPTERIAIKKSADPAVIEFWATYQLAVQTNTNIDPNLVSVQEMLTYLATATTATPPGAGILASSARIAQISNGVAQ